MAKLILKFDLDEEEYEATCALRGRDYRATLEDIDSLIRSYFKYDMNHTLDKADDLLEKIRNMIIIEE